MEASEGVKSFLEFFKERLSNKFFLTYVFFFCSYNWPILIYLFFDENNENKYKSINSYLSSHPYCDAAVPVAFSALFLAVSPWISFGIERYSYFVNIKRFIKKYKYDEDLLQERGKLLKLRGQLIEVEADISGKEKEIEEKNKDVNIFNRLNSILSEETLKTSVDLILNNNFGIYHINVLNSFLISAELVENRFTEDRLANALSNVVLGLKDFLNIFSEQHMKSPIVSGAFVRKEGITKDQFGAMNDSAYKLIKSYVKYREEVNLILGK
jgi:hypothetical protein